MKNDIPDEIANIAVTALLPYIPGLTAHALKDALNSNVGGKSGNETGEPLRQRLLTGKQAQDYLHISGTTLWRLVTGGRIKTVNLNGGTRYDVKELDRFIRRSQK